MSRDAGPIALKLGFEHGRTAKAQTQERVLMTSVNTRGAECCVYATRRAAPRFPRVLPDLHRR